MWGKCHVCKADLETRTSDYTVYAAAADKGLLSIAPVEDIETVLRIVCGPCLDLMADTGPNKGRPSKRGQCIMCGVDARGKLGKSCLWDDGPRNDNEHDHIIKARMCHTCYEEHVDEDGFP